MPCLSLADSGNDFKCVISKDFFNAIKKPRDRIIPLPRMAVSTAQEGHHLRVLGEPSRELVMELEGTALRYKLKPLVIDQLAMPVNISGPFMRENGWDLLLSQNAIRIGRTQVPLVGSHGPPRPTAAVAYVAEVATLPGGGATQVEVILPPAV